MDYTFTLTFDLPPAISDADNLLSRLAAAGCTDALVGLGVPGRVSLEFVREASSEQAAHQSAVAAVERALPGVVLQPSGSSFGA